MVKKKSKKKVKKTLDVNEILLLTLSFIGKKLDEKGKIVNKKNKKLKGVKILPDGTYFGKVSKRKRLEDKRIKNPFGRDKKPKEKLIITGPKKPNETDKEYQQRKRTDDIINITQDNPIAGLLVSNLMGKDFSEYSGKNFSDSQRNIMAISEKLKQDNLSIRDQERLVERLVGVVTNIPQENINKTLNTNQGKKLRKELGFETDVETESESEVEEVKPKKKKKEKPILDPVVEETETETEVEEVKQPKKRGVKKGTKRGSYKKKGTLAQQLQPNPQPEPATEAVEEVVEEVVEGEGEGLLLEEKKAPKKRGVKKGTKRGPYKKKTAGGVEDIISTEAPEPEKKPIQIAENIRQKKSLFSSTGGGVSDIAFHGTGKSGEKTYRIYVDKSKKELQQRLKKERGEEEEEEEESSSFEEASQDSSSKEESEDSSR